MTDAACLLLARNPANRRVLGELLENEGLAPVESGDVDEARKRVKAGGGLAMALVDVGGLPEEVWGLCEELSEAGVPVIVVTATRTQAVQEGTLRAGVHSVLEKPVRKANLAALVTSLADGG